MNTSCQINAWTTSIPDSGLPGMQGEPLPYLPRAEWPVTCILFICLFVISYVMGKGKKYITQHFRNFFQHKQRISLFDSSANSEFRYILLLGGVTCISVGFCFFDYYADTSPELLRQIPHLLLLGIYIGCTTLFIILKWLGYRFVNWIFFDKERNVSWTEAYFDLFSGICLILFPVVLLIVYFDLDPHISKIILCVIYIFTKILLFYKCIRNFFYHFHGTLHLILYFCALEIAPDLFLWKGIGYMNHILI